MDDRVVKSLEALTALSYSVLRRVPTLSGLTKVTIARQTQDDRGDARPFTWRLSSIDVESGPTKRQIELAEEALRPWRERYDLA